MAEYHFILKFDLPDGTVDGVEYLEPLLEQGCDDAMVVTGTMGRLALDFEREADDAAGAIVSAIRDVQAAVPGAKLVEVGPDLMGLSDIAELVGCSRQNMRKYAIGEIKRKARFPAPAYSGKTILWHGFDALSWLRFNSPHMVPARILEVVRCARIINGVRDTAEQGPALAALVSVASEAVKGSPVARVAASV